MTSIIWSNWPACSACIAQDGFSRRGRQRHRRSNPRELLVEVDAHHLAAREADEILRQDRCSFVVGTEKHHPDLGFHSAAVGSFEGSRILDFLLDTPAASLFARDAL